MADASEPIHQRKVAMRQRMRMMRGLIDDRELRSLDLWSAVARLPSFAAAANVMAFSATKGEPDTDSLFARLAAAGKSLVLPSVEAQTIVPRRVGDGLVEGRYGILTPVGVVVDVVEIDLVIVPGLAFTADGRRLGQGGGHYDRFLPTLRVACTSVGVCFAEQLVDDVPTDGHDCNVTLVVTDAS